MKTEKNDDEHDKPKYISRVNRTLKKIDEFFDNVIVPNGLEELFAGVIVVAIIITVIGVIVFFLPIVIKLISLWWNLIL